MVTDRVFDETHTTTDIFEELIKPVVKSSVEGINGQ